MGLVIFLVVFAIFIGSCTGEEKRPPATGSACQGSSCETDTEQTSADANRVEQLTETINTLRQAVTNNRRLSATEIDTLQQQLKEKNTELQTLGKGHGGEVETLQQTIAELQEQLTTREQELEAEVSRLRQQLDQQANTTPPDSESPIAEAPITPVCQAKLCAYYLFDKNSNQQEEVKIAVEKGSASSDLTITEGFFRGESTDSGLLMVNVYIKVTEKGTKKCYYTQMKPELFDKRVVNRQPLTEEVTSCDS